VITHKNNFFLNGIEREIVLREYDNFLSDIRKIKAVKESLSKYKNKESMNET